MTDDQIQQYESSLKKIVKEQVQTETKGIRDDLGSLSILINDYIKSDTAWKNTAQPYVRLAEDGRGFVRTGAYLVTGITAIGVFFVTLFKVVKLINR